MAGASPAQITQWRDAVAGGEPKEDASDSAGAYWAWNDANRDADAVGMNTRRTVSLSERSQMMPGQIMTVYENIPFRRVACLINLPNSRSNADPQLNGLVDRYTAYANAQFVLFDAAQFPDPQGIPQSLPEDFSPRRP